MIASFDLDGGVRLLVEPTAAAKVAAVGVWYDKGSRDEESPYIGATHYVEHMLFKGTDSRNAFSIAREIDRLGGTINAFTERECMALHATVPSDGFEAASAILIDLIFHSLFDQTEFEREKIVIENEIEAANDDPEESAADMFSERLWGSNPLSRKIAGDLNDIKKLDREVVHGFYLDRFIEGPSVITVAGDVDPERALHFFSQFHFSARTSASRVGQKRVVPLRLSTKGPHYHAMPFQHVQVFCAFQIENRVADAEYYALEVANAAVGESMSSRLFQRLREERGLCYSVLSAPTFFSDISLWSAFATTAASNAAKLVDELSDEIVKIRRDGLSETEVSDAKAHIRGGMTIAASDTEYQMRRLARQALYGSPPISVQEAFEHVSSVDVSTANTAMARFLSKDPVFFGVGAKAARRSFSHAVDRAMEKLS